MTQLAKYREQLLNEFENKAESWTYADFERRMQELRKDSSYQDAKGIINEAHKLGKWPNTVKRYLLTNFKVHGNVSGELDSTFRSVCNSLTQSERNEWGVG